MNQEPPDPMPANVLAAAAGMRRNPRSEVNTPPTTAYALRVSCGSVPARRIDGYIRSPILYIHKGGERMALTITSLRLDTELADEAARVLGVKTRTEAVHAALREIVALKKFKALMARHGRKMRFEAQSDESRHFRHLDLQRLPAYQSTPTTDRDPQWTDSHILSSWRNCGEAPHCRRSAPSSGCCRRITLSSRRRNDIGSNPENCSEKFGVIGVSCRNSSATYTSTS